MKKIPVLEEKLNVTPIYQMTMNLEKESGQNEFYMKRDDFVPFSFGGNKARKAWHFYHDMKEKQSGCVVTYGSSSSNHVRIIGNMAKAMGIPCYAISPEENYEETANTKIIKELGVTVWQCPVTAVKATIDGKMAELQSQGKNPYFIMGGGHGILGTKAYVECYEEIVQYEKEKNLEFDYIFHASGTGGTQAGLICGQIEHGHTNQIIVGISIARKEAPGSGAVRESVCEYLPENKWEEVERYLHFTDQYICGGYGKYDQNILDTIEEVFGNNGIPMDTTYVGKAFHGMIEYCKEQGIENKKILFIHTGGTPLYFDNGK